MHLRLLIIFYFIFSFNCYSQKTINSNLKSDSTNILKWTLATINIETVASNQKLTMQLFDYFRPKVDKGEITFQEVYHKVDSIIKNLPYQRYSGSSVFLKNNDSYYLITARHVLIDETRDGADNIFSTIFLIDDINHITNRSKDTIINGNEFLNVTDITELIPGYLHTIISDKTDDIGIIQLSKNINGFFNGDNFVKTLLKRGFKPIEIKDIDSICVIHSDEKIISIGYPQESLLAIEKLSPFASANQSNQITIPIVTKGTIDAVFDSKNQFYSNIFVYHGNSGGPIIRKNKLVGIVSGADFVDEKIYKPYIYLHAVMKKSTLIYKLLQILDKAK